MVATVFVENIVLAADRAKWAHGVTRHAWERMTARRIPARAVAAALTYGRRAHVRGATIRAIGRREVARYRAQGIDLAQYEGVQVVCGHDGAVLTAYRNRSFRGLRPKR
jgi:hypothetical protein